MIDDDKYLNLIHSQILRAAGYKNSITTFSNAQDALTEIEDLVAAHDELPEVIFLDIQMPGIDGFQFLKEFERLVHQSPGRCEVYMLSSAINPQTEIRAKSFKSVHKMVHKPLDLQTVRSLFNFS